MPNINPQEYQQLTNKATPNSPILKNLCFAFLIGGLICTLGQVIYDIYKYFGLSKELCATVTSISLIFIGALLTGLNIYDKIAVFAGAGTIVPITGFANAIVAPAMEFKSEGHILGMSAKMFTIAGPVLVFGTTASVVAGIVLWALSLFMA